MITWNIIDTYLIKYFTRLDIFARLLTWVPYLAVSSLFARWRSKPYAG